MSQIYFKEVTDTAGISYMGQSYGASWGDVNGDFLPDLWTSNHYSRDILYINQGDGTFTDATSEVLVQELKGDTHGAAWADFDNDGDQDLVQLVGAQSGLGSGSNRMYVNDKGRLQDQARTLAPEFHLSGCCCVGCQKLEDRANALGVDYPLGRGRTPLWLDYDSDGWLDLLVTALARPDGQAPPTIFRQTSSGFEDERSTTGLGISNSLFGLLSDLSKDNKLDLFVKNSTRNGQNIIYDITSVPFEDLTATLQANIRFEDVAAADFNGDLLPDLYLTQSGLGSSGIHRDSSNSFRAKLTVDEEQEGMQFDTAGNVTFKLRQIVPKAMILSLSDIYVGSGGFNPTEFQFTLSPNNPKVHGIFPYTPGVDRGVYIGYNPNLQRWQLLLSSPDKDNLTALIQATETISRLTAIGFDATKPPLDDKLLINSDRGFADRSEEAGINSVPTAGRSVVDGDFDNDMDVDIYVAAAGPAGNRPNILYENQGDGTFIAVPDAGGAAGSALGGQGTVTTADYDLDGFLDLFLTNGEWPPLIYDDGPHQLFRNQGNENHWLEIDLEGVVSNRDGIGAQILATAGGVTQLREQSGGIRNAVQDHQRIHFGLADHLVVDELAVRWPSGVVQRLENIPADQLIRIIEPSGPFSLGQPEYEVGAEEGVFLWQDTIDGPYHLRVTGAGAPTNFEIELISTSELLETSPVGLEPNDEWEVTQFGFSLHSQVINRQDGVDFYLAPGAEALLSVTQDGVANPRQLNVGSERSRLAPAGWIVGSDEFPLRPSSEPGEDFGLFVGQGSSPETLEFRWSGDGNFHQTDLSVLASEETASVSPVELDGGGQGRDEFTRLSNGVGIQGAVGTGQDGLDVTTLEPVQIGFAYQQDGLTQPHRINPYHDLLGFQNAYWLPLATS